MLISERGNLAFVQIPKNATKSIKAALVDSFGLDLAPMAEDVGWTIERFAEAYDRGAADVVYNPAVGRGSIDHLTLPFWAEHFPKTWEALRGADSFALIREPRGRFLSALLQRLGQFRDMKDVRADDPAVREEAKRVCDWLDGRGPFFEREYIHFTRQEDFVDLNGERQISAIFPLNRTDAVAQWVHDKTGQGFNITQQHVRREPKKWAKLIQPSARFVGRHMIPNGVKKAVYPLWRNSGVFADASSSYDRVGLGDEVESFISAYYAGDFALFEEARQAVGARSDAAVD